MNKQKNPGAAATAHRAKGETNFQQQPNLKTGHRQRIKRIIVWAGVHGVLPTVAAHWLIKRGGLRHV